MRSSADSTRAPSSAGSQAAIEKSSHRSLKRIGHGIDASSAIAQKRKHDACVHCAGPWRFSRTSPRHQYVSSMRLVLSVCATDTEKYLTDLAIPTHRYIAGSRISLELINSRRSQMGSLRGFSEAVMRTRRSRREKQACYRALLLLIATARSHRVR